MGRRESAPRQAVHRTIVEVDVAGYGDVRRTSGHRLVLRQALYRALRRAFADSGVPWKDCRHVDCGDGVLVLVPPGIPQGPIAASLPRAPVRRLRHHNARHRPEEQLRLRMALHAGEVVHDEYGVTYGPVDQPRLPAVGSGAGEGRFVRVTGAARLDHFRLVPRRSRPADAVDRRNCVPPHRGCGEGDLRDRPADPPRLRGEIPGDARASLIRGSPTGPGTPAAVRDRARRGPRHAPGGLPSACRAKSRPTGPGSYMDDHSGRRRHRVLPAQGHGRRSGSIPGRVSRTSLGRRNQRPRKEIFRPPVGFCAVLVIPCAVSAEMGRD